MSGWAERTSLAIFSILLEEMHTENIRGICAFLFEGAVQEVNMNFDECTLEMMTIGGRVDQSVVDVVSRQQYGAVRVFHFVQSIMGSVCDSERGEDL
jgi:hypothetical protein